MRFAWTIEAEPFAFAESAEEEASSIGDEAELLRAKVSVVRPFARGRELVRLAAGS